MAAKGLGARLRALMSFRGSSKNGTGPLETRSTTTYSSLRLASLTSRVNGSMHGNAIGTAAVEASGLLYGAAMAAAEVVGDERVRNAVTPRVLSAIARSWMRTGESCHVVRVRGSIVKLLPVSNWYIAGADPDPNTWIYRVSVPTPDGVQWYAVGRAGLAHSQWSFSEHQPHIGVAPWQSCPLSSSVYAGIEKQVGQMAGGPHGFLMPTPDTGADEQEEDDELSAFELGIRDLAGSMALVPTMGSGFAEDRSEARTGAQDWQMRQMAYDPSQHLVQLRQDVETSIYSASGIPRALVAAVAGNGQGMRESWRQFVLGAVTSKARELANILSETLDSRVRFTHRGLWAHDIASRASAYARMTSGDAALDQATARRLSGLDDV